MTPVKQSWAEVIAADAVQGHHVSRCIPSHGLKIETPHPERITLSSRPHLSDALSLHVAKQKGRAIPPLPGKRLKGADFHQLIILNSFCIIYGLVTVIKNSSLFFGGGGEGGSMVEGILTHNKLFPANPGLLMWNEILLWCPSGKKTCTTQVVEKNTVYTCCTISQTSLYFAHEY